MKTLIYYVTFLLTVLGAVNWGFSRFIRYKLI